MKTKPKLSRMVEGGTPLLPKRSSRKPLSMKKRHPEPRLPVVEVVNHSPKPKMPLEMKNDILQSRRDPRNPQNWKTGEIASEEEVALIRGKLKELQGNPYVSQLLPDLLVDLSSYVQLKKQINLFIGYSLPGF